MKREWERRLEEGIDKAPLWNVNVVLAEDWRVQETPATYIKRHFCNLFHTSETFLLLPDISASAGDSSLTIPVTISGSSCRRESVRFHQAMNKVGTVHHTSIRGLRVWWQGLWKRTVVSNVTSLVLLRRPILWHSGSTGCLVLKGRTHPEVSGRRMARNFGLNLIPRHITKTFVRVFTAVIIWDVAQE